MVLTTVSFVAIVLALSLFASETGAQVSSVIPCIVGNGATELCDSCDESKAIQVTSWDKATWVRNFSMRDAPAESGYGYKVFWKVEQPAVNCRILLMDDFNSDKGSIEPKLSGRIRLSVNKGGCYVSSIRSGGVGVGACCGDACTNIGALPGHGSQKRDVITETLGNTVKHPRPNSHQVYERPGRLSNRNVLAQRDSGGQSPNPWANQPAATFEKWNCKASPNGSTYTKSGKQVLDGNSFPCSSDTGCDMSVSFEASAASSISSEKTTTYTNSQDQSYEISVGWFDLGPTANFAFGYSKEFSEAIATSVGTSNTQTKSKSVSFRQQVTPGFQYNGWWAPTLKCQIWTFACDQGEGPMEKCEALVDANGNLVGESGIMTTGRA